MTDVARWLNKPKSWVYGNVGSLPAFYVGRGLRSAARTSRRGWKNAVWLLCTT